MVIRLSIGATEIVRYDVKFVIQANYFETGEILRFTHMVASLKIGPKYCNLILVVKSKLFNHGKLKRSLMRH